MEEEANKRTEMTQDQLNFNILSTIRNKLESHAVMLRALSALLAMTDDDLIETSHFTSGLASLIDLWLERQSGFIDESLEEIRNEPEYIIQSAHEMLRLIQRGAPPSAIGGFEDIVERLEKIIKTYGNMFRAEADSVLKPLKEIREKEGFRN